MSILFFVTLIWLLLRIICGTKRLNPFFLLHDANEALNKYVT